MIRRVMVDSNLLASQANRQFVGLLAETGGVMMCGTGQSRAEDYVAIRSIVARRFPLDLVRSRVAENVARLDVWRNTYEQAGLWCTLSDDQVRPASREFRETRALISNLWASYRTDPRDEHLAATVGMCGLDGLFTANMAMIEDDDWAALFEQLDLAAPALCRRSKLVDWALGLSDTSQDPELITRLMLGVLTQAPDLKRVLVRWAANLSSAFPEHSRSVTEYLEGISEDHIQLLHVQVSEMPENPVTGDVLRASMAPSP